MNTGVLNTSDGNAVQTEKSVVGNFAYDVSVTGVLAVTGLGFKPSHIIFISTINGTGAATWCVWDGTNSRATWSGHEETADTYTSGTNHTMTTGASLEAYFAFTSMDADGFTGTRTKNSTPTGTANIRYIAIK